EEWRRCGRRDRRANAWRTAGIDHVGPQASEIGGQRRQSIELTLRPAIFDPHIAAIDEAGVAETLVKRRHTEFCTAGNSHAQIADGRLLRARRQRPEHWRCRPAADERDALAPPHSITSSARASRFGGTSIPSAFAVLRLITSSNFVGA